MLYSVVNARLRDTYPDLASFCADHDTTPEDLCAVLSEAGFTYQPELNQFRA